MLKKIMPISLFFIFGLTAFSQNKKKNGISNIYIPAKQELILDYPSYKGFIIDIWNKGKFNLIFSQVLKKNDSISKAKILKESSFNSFFIDKVEFIRIKNELLAPGNISYKIRKGTKPKRNNINKNSKSFFLVNTTIQNIKVYIPGVKNPTIKSNTRLFLNLKIGQSVFLRFANEMVELIKIDESIQNNTQINLADLIDNAINK
tara:strand:+ start:94 stop:705 length:612 start_codon:yes stop_codon:yes gene_type:complete